MEVILSPRKGHAWAVVDYAFGCASDPLVVPNDESKSDIPGLAGVKLQAEWIIQAIITRIR